MPGSLFGGVFAGRRALVTGHTGFKGSWLSEWLLGLGAEVAGYALEPPTDPSLFEELGLADRVTHILGDVRDLDHLRDALNATQPEIVFHLAAQPLVRASYDDPVGTYSTNVIGTVNLLEAIRGCPSTQVAVIVTSDKCYENRETGQAYREDDAMGGWDPYSSSKGCAELVTAAYRNSFFGPDSPVRVATARAGNVIGGGDWAADRIIPDCIRALQAGESVVVRNPGAVRPWQHVLEPLAGYLHLASRMWSGGHEYDGPWNFGPGQQDVVSVRQIVESVIAAWGSGTWVGLEGRDAVHEASRLALDIEKARTRLGWAPLYATSRAVSASVAWYAAHHTGGDPHYLVTEEIRAYVEEASRVRLTWAGPSPTPREGDEVT